MRAETRGVLSLAGASFGAVVLASAMIGSWAASSAAENTRDTDGGAAVEVAEAWVHRALSCFDGVEALTAEISLESIRDRGEASLLGVGAVAARRGGLFRLDMRSPRSLTVVSDGRTVRAWSTDDSLAIEESLGASEIAAVFELVFGQESERPAASVRWLGGAATPDEGGPAALEISVGTAPSRRSRFVVALAPQCPCLRSVVFVRGPARALRARLSEIRIGARLPKSLFTATPPRGARIVRP